MSMVHWILLAGIVAMAGGVVLTNIARDPPSVYVGVYVTMAGAILAAGAEIIAVLHGHL